MTKLSLQDLHILTQKKPVQIEVKKEGLFTKFKKNREETSLENSKNHGQNFEALKGKTESRNSKRPKLTPEEIEAKKNQKEKDLLTQQQQKEALKLYLERRKEALSYLCTTYPLCFDLHDPKPLKIGIGKDVLNEFQESFNISKITLRKALEFYTRRQKYLKNCLKCSHRITLSGEQDATLSQKDKDFAKEKLEGILQKKAVLDADHATRLKKFETWKSHQEKAALKKENEAKEI